MRRWALTAALVVAGTGIEGAAWAQDAPPAEKPPEQPADTPQDKPPEKPPEKPHLPPQKAPKGKRTPHFDLLDVDKSPFPARPLTALGYPVIISPKAVGYLTALPIVRLGRDGGFGTRVRMDPVLGLDNYEIGAPDIHVDVQTDLGGWSNILRFQYFDSEFRGARALRSDVVYDSTFFPRGSVLEGIFEIQQVDLKVLQRLGDLGPIELWASVGGAYTRARTVLKDIGTGRGESNISDIPLFVAGGRVAWTPAPWFSVYGELDGMAWKVHGVRSAALRGAAGFELRIGGGWGVVFDFTANYLESVAGGDNRDELRYLAFGPRVAILAGL